MGTEKAVAQNTLQQEFSSDATSVSLNEHCDGVTLINIRGTNCMTIADFMFLYDMTSYSFLIKGKVGRGKDQFPPHF